MNKDQILRKIEETVHQVDPKAEVILYGSFARGDAHKNSDLDLLILVDKHPLSFHDKIKIEYPLFEIEFDTGQIISPLVLSKKEWNSKFRITPFFENVKQDGVLL